MKKILLLLAFTTLGSAATAQSRFAGRELGLVGFRNPSTGIEFRYNAVSVHAGFYPTILTQDGQGNSVTSTFIRAGVSFWFLPIGQGPLPSSFYTSISYLQALDATQPGQNGVIGDVGFRWFVYTGLNLRLGIAASYSDQKGWKLNPTPGIGYSITLK